MRPVCQIKSYELDPHGFGELLTNEWLSATLTSPVYSFLINETEFFMGSEKPFKNQSNKIFKTVLESGKSEGSRFIDWQEGFFVQKQVC